MRLWIWKPLLVSLLALWLTGCTRSKSDNSSITFSLPQRAAKVVAANAKLVPLESTTSTAPATSPTTAPTSTTPSDDPILSHVVINITGDGISPAIFRSWDRHDSSTPLPTTYSIDSVPKGDNRLIQVLAVYQTPISNLMTIFYGDVTKSLSAATESADISVTSVSGTQTSVNGQIFGRYFNSTTGGPSGDLAIKFAPANRPAMIVDMSTMYNGWFSVFALSNVNFLYELQPGPMQPGPAALFGGPVNLHSPIFDPNQSSAEWNRRTAFYLPYHLRAQGSSGSSTPTWMPDQAQIYVWGFWGNDVAMAGENWGTRAVCRDSLTGSFSQLKVFTPVVANQAAAPYLGLVNLINFGLTPPPDSVLLDQTGTLASSASGVFLGGATSCPPGGKTAGTEFQDWMRVTKYQVDGHGSDGAAGFRGPFRVDSNQNPVQVSGADLRVITAQVLPDVNLSVDEFRVYKKTNVGTDYYLNSPDCTALAGGAFDGYQAAGSGGLDVNGKLSVQTSISQADVTSGVAAVLCPYKSGKPYIAGFFVQGWAFQNQGCCSGGSSGPVATKISASFLNDPTNASPQIYNNVCVPILVQAQDASGNWANFPSGGLGVVTKSASDVFSPNPDCTNPFASNAGWNTMWIGNSMVVYYLSARSGGNPGLNLQITAGSLTPASLTFSTSDQPSDASYLRLAGGPGSLQAFKCYQLNLFTATGAGSTIAANTSGTVYPSVTSASSSVHFYGDPGCSNYLGTLPFGGAPPYAASNRTLYFSYNSMTPAAFSITATGLSGSLTAADTVSFAAGQISLPSAPTKFNVMAPMTMNAGGCYGVTIQLADGNNNPSPLPSALTGDGSIDLSLNGVSGTFYNDPSCMSVSTTTVGFAFDGMQTQAHVSFKPAAAGSGSIQVSGMTASATYTGSAPVTINPEVATQVVYVFPGQTWTSGSSVVTGSPFPVILGSPVTVDVYAVKASNSTIDTSYVSGMGLTLNGATSFNVIGAGPFTAADMGHKQIQVMFTGSYPGSVFFGSGGNFVDQFNGLQIPMWAYSAYSVPTVASTPQMLKAYAGSGTGQFTWDQTVCQPVFFLAVTPFSYTANSVTYNYAPTLPGATAFVSSTPYAGTSLYMESTCTTPYAASSTLVAAGQATMIAWVKWSSIGYNVAGFNSAGGNVYPGIVYDGYGSATPEGSLANYNILGPTGILTGVCQPYAVTSTDSAYNSVAVTSTVNLTSAGASVGQFFSDSGCSTAITQVAFAAERIKVIYFKTVIPAAGHGTVQLNATDGTYSGSISVDVLHYQ